MADRESSVVVSLHELMAMEEQRRREAADAERARLDAAERRRVEEEAALRREHEERAQRSEAEAHERAQRSAVELAQIEAHQAVQLEKSRLEIQVRNYADQLAAREAHAAELQALLDGQRGAGRTPTIAAAALAAVATLVAVIAIAFAARKPPPVVALEPPRPLDNGAELESTRRKIKALEDQILELKTEKTPPPPAGTTAAPKPPVYKPPPPAGGPKCPPGVKGIPMCP